MASAEDPPDPNDNKKWNFKFNPFKILGVSSDDPEPEEVRKAYHSQIRGSHPDKAGHSKEALAKKLTAAYNYLKNADAEKLKEMVKSFNNPNQSDGLVNGDLSNVLVDKTKAEHYRRLFNAHINVAKETHFNDNFQSFYKQVFDNVSTQPEVEYQNINRYECHLCEEDFTHVEHHVEVVYFPFKEYVMSDAEPGFWKYLESVFDKESVNWNPAIADTGDWAREKFSSSLSKTCANLKSVKDKQYTEEALGSFWSNLATGEATIPVLSCLVCNRNESVESICAAVIPLLPKSSQVENVCDDDFIIPAFLKEEKGFKEWTKLALQVSSTCPRLAVTLACAGSSVDPEQEDKFYEIGLNIIKSQSGFNYAHLCFLLGSCDLNFVANKILTLSSHIECQRLAANYMITSKNDGLDKLETLGKKAAGEREIHTASIFYLALIKHHFNNEDADNVIRTLANILPLNKLWRALQALVADIPELALNSEAVAEITIVKILKDWGSTQASLMESILGAILGLRLPASTTVSVQTILTLCGALHNLYGDEERYDKASEAVLQRIKSCLDAKLLEGDAEFIVALARIPGILPVIKDILEHKQFLGRNSAKAQPGSNYHACLLVLRGIYHYKTKRFTEMTSDFSSAAMNTNKKIASAIATFVSSNPMIHERILRGATRKFEQLQAFVDDYTGESLEYSNFPEIFQKVFANEEPHLSACYSVTSKNGGPDLKALEKDILGRGDDEDDEDESRRKQERTSAADLAEKAYNYVNLEVICKGTQETICCLTQAAHYFYKAMLATSEENIAEKFGYLGLIRECCTNQLRNYANIVMLPPSTALHSLRATLSFIFQANQHFSQILRINRMHNGNVNFIDEGDININQQTNDWQMLLNIRTICPVIVPDIFTIAEGGFALHFLQNLSYSMIKEKIQSGLYSHNTPEFLYHHLLFNGVWNECLSPEGTEYEEPIPDVGPLLLRIEKIDNDKDCEEEKARKQKKNEQVLKEKEELEQLQRELEETPLVDRMGFKISRENAMIVLAELYGYGIEEVEIMMNWKRIRRTAEGFMDTANRTLNFDGEQAYTKFLGIQLNPNSQTCILLMEPAVPGDPQKPALFSSVDLLEIFGNKILAGFVSFDEMILPPGTVPEYLRLLIPFHPFFKVRFAGIGPEGDSKERICGTNFLMTLYHLDLLAKIFTTGQEVGANFPFPFLDTENNLLSTLSRELQEALKAIGPRKKARLLRRLECIHRFWFSLEDVEQEIVQPTQQNGGTSTIMYRNVSLVLKTMPMIRNESGELVDAENEFDEDSPEVKFVRGFNEKMHSIEKEFPIIQRIKELAKISSCLSILLGNKDNLEKDIPTVKNLLSLQLPPTRPYSKCGPPGQPCKCCDWVPAVYHHMKVTDEQKLEYLFEKRFGRTVDPAISPEEQMRRLGFHEQTEHGGTNHENEGSGREDSASGGSSQSQNEAGASKPKLDIAQYDRLEDYRCYGGVTYQPNSKSITGIPNPSNPKSYVNWSTVIDVGILAAQFIPATAIPAWTARGLRVLSLINRAAKIGGGKVGVTGSKGPIGGAGWKGPSGASGKGAGGSGSGGRGGGGSGSGGGGSGSGGGSSGSGGRGGGGGGSGSGSGGGGSRSGGGSSGSGGGGSGSGSGGGSGSSSNASNTGRGGGPKVEFPKNDGQTKHIFRDKKGHFKEDTAQNRKFIEDIANKSKFQTDSRGNSWAETKLPDGTQGWVKFRGKTIQNAGINPKGEHRTFNPETGFDSPIKPGQK